MLVCRVVLPHDIVNLLGFVDVVKVDAFVIFAVHVVQAINEIVAIRHQPLKFGFLRSCFERALPSEGTLSDWCNAPLLNVARVWRIAVYIVLFIAVGAR